MSDIVTELRAGPVCWQIMDKAANEIEMLREELDTWKSVFPDIAPERVQPDRSLLEKDIAELRAALRSVVEAWADAYAGDMAVNRAIHKAEKLLP